MVFSNLLFIFLFLPVTIILYFVARFLKLKKTSNLILLGTSLFFYAWGEPIYIWLMIISIIINYAFGIWIGKTEKKKLGVLWLAVLINLSILGYYKYATFLLATIKDITGFELALDPVNLPIGISFFTFNAISYLIDVYRGTSKQNKNIIEIAMFIALFPQLIAGPIVRYNSIEEQLKDREVTRTKFSEGITRFLLGLAKKVIVANQLALLADTIFSKEVSEMSLLTVWIGIIAYSLQIYFDFSAYSDMAVGLGKMFGFEFPENFNYPYISKSISEFWRRWHISLGSWFRDYLYIPLGGGKVAKWKVYRNILIVWTATGFWHGASWTFMAWGFYYGIIIALEKAFLGKWLEKVWRPIQHVYVIVIFMIGWVFFRADNFKYSFEYIAKMFNITSNNIIDNMAIYYISENWLYLLLGIIFSMPIFKIIDDKNKDKKAYVVVRNIILLILFAWVIYNLAISSYNPFIYFRF